MPVPITTSATEEGYTKVTYLTTLNLKFLDANEIGISKTPPVVWSGSLSETATFNTLLSERCNDFFRLMLYQFPEVWRQNSKPYYPFQYAYTGLVYNKDDMRTIGDVIPGSPANKIGIQKGDIIQSIDGIPITNRYNKYSNIEKDQGTIKNNAFSYLIMFDGFYKNAEIRPEGTFLQFIIKRNGNLMTFSIAPEVRVVYLLQENF